MKVVAFVPIRLNSKRVIGKNLKLLGNKPLLTYIFDTLLEVEGIDEVYAFCSSDEIINLLPPKVIFLKRDESLDRDETLGYEIYDAFCNQVNADIYILAHTTSPFIKANSIKESLDKVISGEFDSAFSALRYQTFTWYKGIPLNYSLKSVPRTQDIEPIYIETSSFYIFNNSVWRNQHRRIGERPFVKEIDIIEGIDIDNNKDFDFASRLV